MTDGRGLYLEVSPKGAKRWFWKFRKGAGDSRLALGSYPVVSVSMALKFIAAAKLQRSEGVDPVQLRKVQKFKAANPVGETCRIVALRWYVKQAPRWSESHASRSLRQFEYDLFPWGGDPSLAEIEPLELLAALRRVEARGAVETADRCLMLARQVWHYGFATGRATVDATTGLQKALTHTVASTSLRSLSLGRSASYCERSGHTRVALSYAQPFVGCVAVSAVGGIAPS